MSLDSIEANEFNCLNEEDLFKSNNNKLNNSNEESISKSEFNFNNLNNKNSNQKFCNYYVLPKKGIPIVELEGYNSRINNFWIITKDTNKVINYLLKLFNPQDVYITDTYLSRSFYKHYIGQKIILLTKLPKTPFHFLIKLNSCIVKKGRTIPCCKYDIYYSNDVTLIIISNKKFGQIKQDYLKFNKGQEQYADRIVNDLKKKFSVGYWVE